MKQYISFNHNSNSFSIAYSLKLIFKKVEFVFFFFLCISLMISSKLQSKFSADVEKFFITVSLPVSSFISTPFNVTHSLLYDFRKLVVAKEENKKLRLEIDQLKSLYTKSLNIYEENKELKKVLNFVSSKSSKFEVARILGRSHQVFNHQVYINIGQNRGAKEGNVVVGYKGMMGRISKVLPESSSVILLNDVRSRIPVISSKARVRGILAGDNSNLLKMLYLPKDHNIKAGDMIFTSGDGDTLPPGHLVGKVHKVTKDNKVLVKMVEDPNSLDIVSVISY